METTILTAKNIRSICSEIGLDTLMNKLIKNTHTALENYDKNQIKIPVRSGFSYTSPAPGLIEWMPLMKVQKSILLKAVGYHPNNPLDHNTPTILSNMATYDTRTGQLTSIIDGGLATALRTGAISAIASKLAASPHSKVLGIIGCGAQAVTQLHALSLIFDFEEIRIFDTDGASLDSFEERCASFELSHRFLRANSADEVLEGTDILCTATSVPVNEGPVFTNSDVQKNLHINAIGSDFPGKTEIPMSLLTKATVFPDFLEQALIEGECQQLNSIDIGLELHELLKDSTSNEKLQQEITVFDSTGFALQDMVVSELFLEFANELNIGSKVEMQGFENDVKNPYAFMMSEIPSNLTS